MTEFLDIDELREAKLVLEQQLDAAQARIAELERERKALSADYGNLLAESNAHEIRAERAEKSLREIRENYGKVCDEYETCTHVACAASYSAWATADEYFHALAASRAEEKP